AERLRDVNPVLVVSTAHWAKFGADVYKALSGLLYGDPLPADTAGLTGVELLGKVQELAEDAVVPEALAGLDDAEQRFAGVVDAGCDGVEDAVRAWLDQ
ncbi:MAG: threonine synthase, partial [Coriobacteriia bacterium]|nr:threonine synthase [Coriobacteriia bacterium]